GFDKLRMRLRQAQDEGDLGVAAPLREQASASSKRTLSFDLILSLSKDEVAAPPAIPGPLLRREPHPGHIEHRDRPVQTLERQLPGRLGVDQMFDSRLHLAVDQDLAVAALAAEARGEVHDCADRGVVEAALEADAAERCEALRDADAEAELV